MSKNTTLKIIQRELDAINERIDRRIIAGRNYQKEALHHKFLLMQYRSLLAISNRPTPTFTKLKQIPKPARALSTVKNSRSVFA